MYDDLARGYDELHGREQKSKVDFIKNIVDVRSFDSILDVGCGTTLSFLSENAVGVDSSFEMLRRGKGVRFCAKSESLPFKDNSFDLVTCITSIHNFEDVAEGIKEIKRVAKKSVVVTILKKSPKAKKIRSLLEKEFEGRFYDQVVDLVFVGKKNSDN